MGELKVIGGGMFVYNPRHLPVAWAPGPCVIDDQRSQKRVDGEVFNARAQRRKVAKVLEMKLL